LDEDVVDDWENADIDDMAQKLATKEVKQTATTTTKGTRKDEEEEHDDKEVKHTKTKHGKE
jgi:hypothetical protein